MNMPLARLLIGVGLLLVAVGIVVAVCVKLHIPLGRLPGDILYRGRYGTIYIPWVTMLLLSLLASLVLWFFRRPPG